MGKICKQYAAGALNDKDFKTFIYFFSHYLQYLKTDSLEEMDCRLSAIESLLSKSKPKEENLKLC